jgi:hypothetical protein
VSKWESRYYGNYLRLGIDHFLNNANLAQNDKEFVMQASFQVIECVNT